MFSSSILVVLGVLLSCLLVRRCDYQGLHTDDYIAEQDEPTIPPPTVLEPIHVSGTIDSTITLAARSLSQTNENVVAASKTTLEEVFRHLKSLGASNEESSLLDIERLLTINSDLLLDNIDHVLRFIETKPNPPNSRMMLLAWARHYSSATASHLASLLALDVDEEPGVRVVSIRIIADQKQENFESVLTGLLSDANELVRRTAMQVLPAISNSDHVRTVQAMMHEPDYRTQVEAIRLLSRSTSNSDVAKKIMGFFASRNFSEPADDPRAQVVDKFAVRALGAVDSEEARASLKMILADTKADIQIRMAAADALMDHSPSLSEQVIAHVLDLNEPNINIVIARRIHQGDKLQGYKGLLSKRLKQTTDEYEKEVLSGILNGVSEHH